MAGLRRRADRFVCVHAADAFCALSLDIPAGPYGGGMPGRLLRVARLPSRPAQPRRATPARRLRRRRLLSWLAGRGPGKRQLARLAAHSEQQPTCSTGVSRQHEQLASHERSTGLGGPGGAPGGHAADEPSRSSLAEWPLPRADASIDPAFDKRTADGRPAHRSACWHSNGKVALPGGRIRPEFFPQTQPDRAKLHD
jgi:hypothetical protein